MDKQQLDHFRALICKKKEELQASLGYLKSNSLNIQPQDSGDTPSYSFHMADHAGRTSEQEIAFSLASREGRYLYHLNEALRRIEEGVYGICRACGGEISIQRLEAVPHTTQCIKCKTKEEKKERGFVK